MSLVNADRKAEALKKIDGRPFVVAYGLGLDSTAMLVGLVELGIRPDAILFADVGGEKDETYAFLPIMNAYLAKNAFPTVTVVKYQAQDFKHYPPYHSLEENCLTNGTLPSEAFGFGSCSQKWKAQPQNKWMKSFQPAQEIWAKGGRVLKAIGFDASGADSKRRYKADSLEQAAQKEGKKVQYDYWYPLQDWDWNRVKCAEVVKAAGLPVPAKSSCLFCPNIGVDEVRALPADKLRRIVLMEARALPRLTAIEGLWRNGCKGVKDPSKKRPGSMSVFIREQGLLPASEIDAISAEAPKDLMSRASAHADGMKVESWDEYFDGMESYGCESKNEAEAFEV